MNEALLLVKVVIIASLLLLVLHLVKAVLLVIC
jgi:hypothetical protein